MDWIGRVNGAWQWEGWGEGGGAADTVRVRWYYLKGNDEKCVHEENASHKCSIEKKKSIDDKNSKIKK